MKKFLLVLLVFSLLSAPSFAATSREIADAHKADPAAAIKAYGWEEMEFTGTVESCELVYNDCARIWEIRIPVDGADIVGYTTRQLGTGAAVTMKGNCSGLRLVGDRVTIVLDNVQIAGQ
ncbi:MAG: hypothetical protein LBT65_05515 [Synergistaceae bacterium]|jgi:hypothetical protein|nr:hypothetical protein [Synergistaceae bacterium]